MKTITILVFSVVGLLPAFCNANMLFFGKNTWKTVANFLTPQNEEKLNGTQQSFRSIPSVYEDLFCRLKHQPWCVCVHLETKALFTENIDKRDRGKTSLHVATIENFPKAAKALIKLKVPLNAEDLRKRTALHHAALNNRVEIGEMLILAGADQEKSDHIGNTPLHYAVQYNHMGDSPWNFSDTLQNSFGQSPLHIAVKEKNLEFAKMLIQAGVEVTPRDHCGNTALHLAAKNGQLIIGRMLIDEHIDAGVGVNQRGLEGFSPLHSAAIFNHLDFGRILVDAGADVDARNDKGQTPLDLAQRRKFEDFGQMLGIRKEN